MRGVPLSVLLPLMAILLVVVVAGGLGTLFTVLSKTGLEQWGVVVVGMLIVVGVPTLGYLASRKSGSGTQSHHAEEKHP